MSFIIKELIKGKIKQLTVDEFLHYAKEYGFSVTADEASTILHYLQTNDLDIFSKDSIESIYQKITEVTNPQTANKAKKLLNEIIKSYGLENYFY